MRVVVDRRQLDSDATLMGAIGHELQHALEALSDPSVTDSEKMFFFFRRYAPTTREQFETQAAVKAGDAVEDELRHRRSAAPLLPVDPQDSCEPQVTALALPSATRANDAPDLVERKTLEAALFLAGPGLATLPIELTSSAPDGASPRAEGWTIYRADGQSERILIYTGSGSFVAPGGRTIAC